MTFEVCGWEMEVVSVLLNNQTMMMNVHKKGYLLFRFHFHVVMFSDGLIKDNVRNLIGDHLLRFT